MNALAVCHLFKRDAEVQLLVGCTPDEARLALATDDQQSQAGLLVWRQEE